MIKVFKLENRYGEYYQPSGNQAIYNPVDSKLVDTQGFVWHSSELCGSNDWEPCPPPMCILLVEIKSLCSSPGPHARYSKLVLCL